MEASLDGLSEVDSLQKAKLEPGPVELGWVQKRYSVFKSCCRSRLVPVPTQWHMVLVMM